MLGFEAMKFMGRTLPGILIIALTLLSLAMQTTAYQLRQTYQHQQFARPRVGTGRLSVASHVDTKRFRYCPLKPTMGDLNELIPFYVPHNDEYVGGAICNTGNHQDHILAEFLRHINLGDTVIDAGGNLGTYAVQFARKVGPTGRVAVFEPQPMLFPLLVANSIFGGLGNMDLHRVALGFRAGVTQMESELPDGVNIGKTFEEVNNVGPQGAKINFGGRSLGKGGEPVVMRTLDSFNISNVKFLKIDVQGAESMLIYGAQETILRWKPVINLEDSGYFDKRMATKEIIEALQIPPEVQKFHALSWLRSIGYQVIQKIQEELILAYQPTEGLPSTLITSEVQPQEELTLAQLTALHRERQIAAGVEALHPSEIRVRASAHRKQLHIGEQQQEH